MSSDKEPSKDVLTEKTKFQAKVLARMNEYRAELCRHDQPALREVFLINAKFLREISA